MEDGEPDLEAPLDQDWCVNALIMVLSKFLLPCI